MDIIYNNKYLFIILFIIIVVVLFIFFSKGFAQSDNLAEGEALERQMWKNFKDHNWSAVEKQLAPNFQSIHSDGTRDRAQELAFVKAFNLADFTLTDFKVTEGKDSYIVTYKMLGKQTIKGERDNSVAYRLSVWNKNGEIWQWVAHANLIPINQK